MIIIGVDFHPEFQQVASVDTDTGEFQEKRLAHREEAEKFYRALIGKKVRVGMEASGHARWFERLLSELQFELNIGEDGRSPRSPWRGDWRFGCTGCGAKGWDYEQLKQFGSHAGEPGNRDGVTSNTE